LLRKRETEIDLPDDLPMANTDFVLLEQVFFNLLDNAAKYTPSGSRIRIAGRADGADVAVAVIDEGAGIPDEAAEAIFDKFTRLEAGDRKRAGTGLGLAICRGFVQAMGGTVTAGNRLDRSGAVFTVRLPAAGETPPAPAAADKGIVHVG
jgi:two-component system sensor histidine kinase KdpD